MRGYEHKPGILTPKFDKYNQDNLFVSVNDSSIPAELKNAMRPKKNLHRLLILHTNLQH